jgi:porin
MPPKSPAIARRAALAAPPLAVPHLAVPPLAAPPLAAPPLAVPQLAVRVLLGTMLGMVLSLATIPARAQSTPVGASAGTAAPATEPGFLTNLWTRDTLLGDVGGVRTNLARIGLSFGLQDTNEVFGNVTGGIHKGAAYDGLTMLSIGLDTKAAFGLDGGTFNISALNIRGRSLSADNLLAIQTVSGIEAADTTRLWEIWYDQAFLDGRIDVKLGQQSIDQEFITSQGSSTFLNTMMGWPLVPSADLYAGGPAYPLSSLGVRLRARPTEDLTLLGGVFQDNPPGGPFDDDGQLRGSTRYGGNFNLRTGALFIAEAQYTINQPSNGQLDSGAAKPRGGLPGTYKLGFWYDTAPYASQAYDNTGLSLADPNSTGVPATRWHNFSLYAVADQTVWQPDPNGPQAVGVFARLMGAPGDRNLIDFSVNAGVTLKAPLPTRDNDTVGVGFGFAKVGGGAIALDQATNFFSGTNGPVRGSETFVEVTYQFQATPWWVVQPDFQYIFTPGGGIQNPTDPTRSVCNEAVFGARSVVTF